MTTIERNVMGTVRMIYLFRQVISLTALKIYLCVLCLWGIAKFVWVAKVFENLSHVGVAKSLQFFSAAVLQTDLLVQMLLLVGALAVCSLLVDLFRAATPTRAFSL